MGLYQCCQAPSYHPETQEKTAPLVYYLCQSWVGGDGEWRKENKLRTTVAAWGTVHKFFLTHLTSSQKPRKWRKTPRAGDSAPLYPFHPKLRKTKRNGESGGW